MKEEEDQIIRIFTGSEVEVLLLQGELEQAGVSSMTQNDFQSSINAGFGGGIPSAIDLYISESDLEAAQPILDEFMRNKS